MSGGRWQKGQSGNKTGRPKLPPELKAIRELTAQELKRIISKYAEMKQADIEKCMKDPNEPILHVTIASIFHHAAKHGDQSRLAFLMDRVAGKPVSELEAQNGIADGSNEISITPQNIAELCKAARDG